MKQYGISRCDCGKLICAERYFCNACEIEQDLPKYPNADRGPAEYTNYFPDQPKEASLSVELISMKDGGNEIKVRGDTYTRFSDHEVSLITNWFAAGKSVKEIQQGIQVHCGRFRSIQSVRNKVMWIKRNDPTTGKMMGDGRAKRCTRNAL